MSENSSLLHAQLGRYAALRDSTDPAERMAGLVADAEIHMPPLSMGQRSHVVEQLRAAGVEIVDRQPYRRRDIEELLDELELYLVDDAALDDSAFDTALHPLTDVLFVIDRINDEDEEDEE